jgi:hypothetical protein
MKRSEARARAIESGASTYTGRCCHRCKGRKRYSVNAACVRCVNAVATAFRRLAAEHRKILSDHRE